MEVGKTPAKGKAKKEKRMIVAAPQADDDGDEGSTSSGRKKLRSDKGKERADDDGKEGSTSSGRKIQKVRSDKGKERTKINKLQMKDGVRGIKVNTKWQILDPEVSMYIFMN